MTDEEKSAVMSIFANFNVTLKEAWLNEVLEYLHEKRADADTSTITQLVYEQWLYSELSKSTRPTIRLPPFAKKASLKTDVVVQINWIVDIHTSMYSKLREHTGRGIDSTLFQSEVNDNSWDAESEGQMFLMEITDGQRKLRAIEYQKIDGLCTMLLPGTKLFISGDTICRNSVLLLTPKNAVLLGGESEMCQKNAPVVIFARRLGINERKLEIVECKTNSIADGMEMKKINSIQSFASNAPGNSAPQRVIDIRNEESTKRRNIERKNQKKPVLSRTITSYFQQQRRGFHSKMESYNESKSFIHSTDQNIKAQNDVNYPLQCEEENAKFLSSSIISNSAIDSSSSHFPSALAHISELEQESSLTSHKRLSTSEILQSQICNMKKTNDYSHLESKSQKLVEKSTNSTKKCPSSNIANFFVSKKCVEIEASQPLISARLLAKNLEITQSSEIMSTSKEDATAPPNIVLLSGESKRAELPSASKVPIWSVEVQKPLAAESIRSATIIPSSDMQEVSNWKTCRKRQAIDENSKHFLANEFHMLTSNAHTVETAKCTERAHIAAEEGMMGSQYNWKKRLSEMYANIGSAHNFPYISKGNGSSCSIFEPHIEPSSSNSKQIQNEQQKKQQEKYSDDFQALKNNTEQGNVSSSQHSSTTSNQKTEDSSKPLLNVKNANKEASLVLPDATLRVIPHVKTMEQCHSLNILSIREAYCQRRFHLIAYRARVQPVMCKLLAGLQFIGQNWTASLRISDESWESLDCLIDNTAIHDLIGFTPQDAQQAMTSNDLVRITYYKRRAQAMIETFNRLDLVLTVEFSSSPNVIPLIVNITNLAAALTLC